MKANTCLGCHGIPGYTTVYPTYRVPKLGGQNAEYIVAALQAYKTGQRDHPTMHAQARILSSKDMADIAAYFSSIKSDEGTTQQAAAGGKVAQKAQPANKAQARPSKKIADTKLSAAEGSSPGGKSTYKIMCSACHDSGALGAPKVTDKAAWQARIAQGRQALYSSAINGIGAMPAKGGHPQLSEQKVKAAVDYIVSRVSAASTGGIQKGQQTMQQKGQ
jgi:cytochrome c5